MAREGEGYAKGRWEYRADQARVKYEKNEQRDVVWEIRMRMVDWGDKATQRVVRVRLYSDWREFCRADPRIWYGELGGSE